VATSLLRRREGGPGLVSPTPPYPAEQGYKGAPTAVHNVETLACMPFIAREGGAAFAAFGKGESRGMKLFSVGGAVARPGLYELPLGVTLRELLFDHAGGMAEGASFGAAMVGGPLGGVHGEGDLDLPLTFEDLAAVGGMRGHGGVVVFSDETDLVRLGRDLMRFCAVESCGKCFPCRLGSVRGVELFDEILEGRGDQSHLELLSELSETMRVGSLCALGGAIPTPIDLLMTNFIHAFREHIPDAEVPALLAGEEASR
jgi:NADH:ubiquinone oxidoreductase subunit F (NADH-binding)